MYCVDFVLFGRYGVSQWLATQLFLNKKYTNASRHDYKWLSIYEPLDKSDDYIPKLERFSLTVYKRVAIVKMFCVCNSSLAMLCHIMVILVCLIFMIFEDLLYNDLMHIQT